MSNSNLVYAQSFDISVPQTKQRQTLIWEFMYINPISTLHKLKAIIRIKNKILYSNCSYEQWCSFQSRSHKLFMKIIFTVPLAVRKYYFHLVRKYNNNHISSFQFNNYVKNIFTVYGV
jgi:hypothetical protein